MRLDRSRPFGKIAGDIFIPDGCDRPAVYEQGGLYFDAHDRLLEPGKTASIVPTDDDDDDLPEVEMTVAELLRQADVLHWRKLKAHAIRVLGPDCPASKAQIIEALQEVQKEFDARLAKREKAAAPRAVAPAAKKADGGVDLAAWARGQKEYLFGDIRKAIKAEYGRNVQERDDAVEFLVEQGVVYAEHARKDVIREA